MTLFNIIARLLKGFFTVLSQATQKAALALKSGRILTPSHDSLCGVNLQPRETYVITGKNKLLFLLLFL